jgi:hypothetical protein
LLLVGLRNPAGVFGNALITIVCDRRVKMKGLGKSFPGDAPGGVTEKNGMTGEIRNENGGFLEILR